MGHRCREIIERHLVDKHPCYQHWSSTVVERMLNLICFNMLLRPRQNGRHFADDIFKCIFLNGSGSIAIKILLKFVPKGQINNIPALVQIMTWCWPGDKPLSEALMVRLSTHIGVTRPQWVKFAFWQYCLCGKTNTLVEFQILITSHFRCVNTRNCYDNMRNSINMNE